MVNHLIIKKNPSKQTKTEQRLSQYVFCRFFQVDLKREGSFI